MLTQISFKRNKTWLIVMSAVILLVSACTLSDVTPTSDQISTDAPEGPGKPTSEPAADSDLNISLDTANVAMGYWVDIVPAGGEDGPHWTQLPEYSMATLEGYLISGHRMQPQVFVFPVDGLAAANPETGEIVDLLKALIEAPQEDSEMPFLPTLNEMQIFHTHLQYLDFKNGHGLRYLTMFSQGIVPVSNVQLIYTFQGLTEDGKYFVSAILPVTHPSLPADETITGSEPPEFLSDYRAYLENVAAALNPQTSSSFVPDLTLLDAMISSIEIND